MRTLLGVVAALTVILSCPLMAEKPVVYVTDADELYAAVNDVANAGKTVYLEPGIYYLDSTKPNDGRLVLQERMDLVGGNEYVDHDGDGIWDPIDGNPLTETSNYVIPATETVIDGQDLNVFSNQVPMVELGHNNGLERLTVKNFGSAIPAPPGVTRMLIGNAASPPGKEHLPRRMTVTNCLVEDDFPETPGHFRGGISCINTFPEQDGAVAQCTLIGNIVRRFPRGPLAINVSNVAGVSDAKVRATLKHNRSEFNTWGLIFGRGGRPPGDDNEVKVLSICNLYSNNFGGVWGSATNWAGSFNQSELTSVGDVFANNTIVGPFLMGNANSQASHSNSLRAELLGTRFVGNPFAFRAIGSRTGGAATNNTVTLLVRDAVADNVPVILEHIEGGSLANGNQVIMIGSPTAFEGANTGLTAPPLEGWNP